MNAFIETLSKVYENDVNNFKLLVKNRPVIECSTSGDYILDVFGTVGSLLGTRLCFLFRHSCQSLPKAKVTQPKYILVLHQFLII